MKFSQHIGKGIWAFASRGLPLLYAAALISVARVIPKSEFGLLAIFQTFFTIIIAFSDSFALQAIVKYSVEPDINLSELLTVITALFLTFLMLSNLILIGLAAQISSLLKVPELSSLFPCFALLSFISVPRAISSKILQSNFRVREIFWVDFGYFAGSSGIIFVMLLNHQVAKASDVIWVTVVSAGISSIVGIIFTRKSLNWRPQWSSSTLKRISTFVKYQAATGIVSVAQQNFDTLIVSSFTGAVGAATYQGAKILYRGFDIVRDTTLLFVFPASSKYHSQGDVSMIRKIGQKSLGFLYWLLIPVSILLAIVSPFIFHTLWGIKYNDSISLFKILMIASVALPIQIVSPIILIGMGHVKKVFHILAFTLSGWLILSLVLLSTIGITGAAIAFVITIFMQAFLYYRTIQPTINVSVLAAISGVLNDGKNYFMTKKRSKHLE